MRWLGAILRNLFARHHLTFSPTDPMPSLWIYLQAPLKKLGIAPGGKRLKAAQPPAAMAVQPAG